MTFTATTSESDNGACWLVLEEPLRLFTKASVPVWSEEELGPYHTEPVKWEQVGHSCYWRHEIVWCPRRDGSVMVHRFSPCQMDGLDIQHALEDLRALAVEEISSGEPDDSASNVGGFHGQRDLWTRAHRHGTALPSLVSDAIEQASRAEARSLGRSAIPTTADECWFNVLNPGAWNTLHTHPGSTYSGTFYIADEIGCQVSDALAGRIAFLAEAPEMLGGDDLAHVLRRPHSGTVNSTDQHQNKRRRRNRCAEDCGSCLQGHRQAHYLVLDPTPGTCVVFPSFMPHFVMPAANVSVGEQCPLRLSVAFNFGACHTPVLAHLVPIGSYVKLLLEPENVLGMLPKDAHDTGEAGTTAQKRAQAYLQKHCIADIMEDAVNDAIQNAAADPIMHMASFLHLRAVRSNLNIDASSVAEAKERDADHEDDGGEAEEEEEEEEVDAQEYLEQHEPFRIIEEVVNAVLRANSVNPVMHMAEHLQKMAATISILNVSAALIDIADRCHLEICISTTQGQREHQAVSLEAAEGMSIEPASFSSFINAIRSAIIGMSPADQNGIDGALIQVMEALRNTMPELSLKVRSLAVHTVSLAVCRAGSASKGVALYHHIAEFSGVSSSIPVPVFAVGNLSRESLADSSSKLCLVSAGSIADAMKLCAKTLNHWNPRVDGAGVDSKGSGRLKSLKQAVEAAGCADHVGVGFDAAGFWTPDQVNGLLDICPLAFIGVSSDFERWSDVHALRFHLEDAPTVSTAVSMVDAAHKAGKHVAVCHSSSVGGDDFAIDFAVGTKVRWLRLDAPCSTEKLCGIHHWLCKYRRLLSIETELNNGD